MEFLYALISVIPILCLTSIAIVISHYNYKEYKLDKKTDILSKVIDKGYEFENIDLNEI